MRRTAVRRLIEFVLLVDGAQMQCTGCDAVRPVPEADLTQAILLFQEQHFDCDPHLVHMPAQRSTAPSRALLSARTTDAGSGVVPSSRPPVTRLTEEPSAPVGP